MLAEPKGPYRECVVTRSRSTALSVLALTASGCFNPDPVDQDTDSLTGSSSGTAGDTADPTSNTDTQGPTTDDTTGVTPECRDDGDCASMAGECEVATCNDAGACIVDDAPEGTACGDATDSACDLADTCDGSGTCSSNLAPDGTDCSECESGQCTCNAGSCGECIVYADTNLFSTARSLVGWELTGDWGLFTAAPASQSNITGVLYPAVPFDNQVLGTDGNRHGPAYPGGHMEFSYARTPPTELPSTLEFQSWHLDEGAGTYDNKIIRISTDGGSTWTDIISCELDPELPFCQQVNERDGDDWDSISLSLPAPLIGQTGIIEFAYDTFDDCCAFEKGWYIDVTNFATECACTSNDVCEPYATECGAGVCGGNGGCNLDAVAAGTECGAADSNVCTAPDACDGFGYCQREDAYPPLDGDPQGHIIPCNFCEAGDDCVGCAAGECQDCTNLPDIETFDPTNFAPFLAATFNWTFDANAGGDWGILYSISNNEQDDGTLFPSNAPFLGIDGNYASPPDGTGEVNHAVATTRPDVFADTVQFISWHQDQGGASLDRKLIELSVDDGTTWVPLADCTAPGPLSAFPFCTAVADRDAEDWDTVSIDTSAYADMTGQLRFTYRTVTACCTFERGWYIDDLNFSQTCDAPNPSVLNAPCPAWPTEELCNVNQTCAWTGTDCMDCDGLAQEDCEAEPLCMWRVGAGGSGCTRAL